jgi:hypothetical protein
MACERQSDRSSAKAPHDSPAPIRGRHASIRAPLSEAALVREPLLTVVWRAYRRPSSGCAIPSSQTVTVSSGSRGIRRDRADCPDNQQDRRHPRQGRRGSLRRLVIAPLRGGRSGAVTWDSGGLTSQDLDDWAAQPDIEMSYAHRLVGREVRRYVQKKADGLSPARSAAVHPCRPCVERSGSWRHRF